MIKLICLLLFTLLGASWVNAAPNVPFTPASNEVVASWTPIDTTTNPMQSVELLLEYADMPGKSARNIARAQQLLSSISVAESDGSGNDQRLLFAQAKIAQHQHKFTQARKILDSVLSQTPDEVNSRLLLVTVLVNLGEPEAAKAQCQRLIGQVANVIVTTCWLDAQSQVNLTERHYQQLVRLTQQQPPGTDAVSVWIREVLASMALQLGKPQEALQHLSPVPLEDAHVSFLNLWSEVQLTLNRPKRIVSSLSQLTEDNSFMEDPLLLQLARAEKALENGGDDWQHRMAERVAFRIARRDISHAFEISRYFLLVENSAEQALTWARLNWQQSKRSEDWRLLQQAEAAYLLVSSDITADNGP